MAKFMSVSQVLFHLCSFFMYETAMIAPSFWGLSPQCALSLVLVLFEWALSVLWKAWEARSWPRAKSTDVHIMHHRA